MITTELQLNKTVYDMEFIINLTQNDSQKHQKTPHLSVVLPLYRKELRKILLEYLQWMQAVNKDDTFQVFHHHHRHHNFIVFHHNSIVFPPPPPPQFYTFPKILSWRVFLPLSEIKFTRFWRLLPFHRSAWLTLF